MTAPLREPTLLVGWFLNLFEDAGEAGGGFRSSRPRGTGPGFVSDPDPERSRLEAARRARTRLRRYCTTNRLNRLGTLTYAGEGLHDPVELRKDVAGFFRRLKSGLDGDLPYVWVPEWHKSGHGLHVHFAVGRYVPRGLIDECWGHGFVHIKLLSDLPVGAGSLEESRRAAGYLSKYVTKSFADDLRNLGSHRYEIGQGFKPRSTRVHGVSERNLIEKSSEIMGAKPSVMWFSRDVEDWQAPPALWLSWK
jgi:hypothetical protein